MLQLRNTEPTNQKKHGNLQDSQVKNIEKIIQIIQKKENNIQERDIKDSKINETGLIRVNISKMHWLISRGNWQLLLSLDHTASSASRYLAILAPVYPLFDLFLAFDCAIVGVESVLYW